VIGALTLIALLSSPSVAAQPGQAEAQLTIAVDVDLVVFNVTVVDGKGRPVAGLQPGDFVLSEDGRPQVIVLYRAEDVPATVGLVIDNSGSMIDNRSEVVDAAVAFMAARNPSDELFVVNFNEERPWDCRRRSDSRATRASSGLRFCRCRPA
jgi:hypothetical protein